jgi:polysaccharide biosynthesis transport protein
LKNNSFVPLVQREGMNTNFSTPHDYLAVLKRRRWYLLVPAVVLGVASLLVAFLLPPVYRSSGTILIEQPEIPSELVASTVTTYASERLQVIEQRVMTSDTLIGIINKYNLYPKDRAYQPMSAVVEKMRASSGLTLISARSGRSKDEQTIAFSVFFDYDNPQVAQRVANELVSLYLSENIRGRQDRAAGTTAFLAAEAQRLDRRINESEAQLATLRQRYAGSLPGQMDNNQNMIARTEADLRALDQRAETIKQGLVFLQAQLAQVDPYRADFESGLSLTDRLRELRAELVMLSARYKPGHPTLVQLREEAAALEKAVGAGTDVAGLRGQRERLHMELALARQNHTDAHPDVLRLQRSLDTLDAEIVLAQRQDGAVREGLPPDNLAYIQLAGQVESAKADLQTIAVERERLKEWLEQLDKRIEQAPEVEREYQRLARVLETAVNERRAIAASLRTAQLGETLETERKSEKFTLIEPPRAPNEPIKPNRGLILTLGMLLSLGAGVAMVVLAEAIDTAVHGPKQLAVLTGFAPLATIPYIQTRLEIHRRWQRRIGFAVVSVGVLAGLIVSVHLYVSPLDVLWARLERGVEMTVTPLTGN